MRIRIIKSTSPHYWYSKKIGQIFTAEEYSKTRYLVPINECFIDKVDCELLHGLDGASDTKFYLVEITRYHQGGHARGWYSNTNRVGETYKVIETYDGTYHRSVYEVIKPVGSYKDFQEWDGKGLHIEKDDCKVLDTFVPEILASADQLRGRYRIIMEE